MKDEIKEIDALLFYLIHTDRLKQEEKQYIADYITNLQEKCENYRKLKERYQIEKELYKSRNEKAIEYINQYKECEEYSELPCYETYYKDLDIILNGDDNEKL